MKLSILFAIIFFLSFSLAEVQAREKNFSPRLDTTAVYSSAMVNSAIAATNHMKWVSFENKQKVQVELANHGWKLAGNIIEPKRSGGRAYVAYHPQMRQIVISFRGSKSKGSLLKTVSNIKTDLNFRMKKLDWLGKNEHPDAGYWRKLKVHAGFNNEYKRFRQTILQQVRRIPSYRQSEIFVVGFSLGSALAMHAALDIKLILKKRPFVYVGGTPRIGSEKFRVAYEKSVPNTLRIMLAHDLIPRIPSKRLGYTHIGRLLALNTLGQRLSIQDLENIKGKKGAGMKEHDYEKYHQALVRHQSLAKQVVRPNAYFKIGLLYQLANAERK